MNKKRNVSYIKPEDPAFLKALKKQAGYDDRNHKFDELENAEEDFVEDDESEKPQVVVLKKGDLTAEEAELEQKRIEQCEAQTKADLNQKVIFKSKKKTTELEETKKRKHITDNKEHNLKKKCQLLSFDNEEEDDDDDDDDDDN